MESVLHSLFLTLVLIVIAAFCVVFVLILLELPNIWDRWQRAKLKKACGDPEVARQQFLDWMRGSFPNMRGCATLLVPGILRRVAPDHRVTRLLADEKTLDILRADDLRFFFHFPMEGLTGVYDLMRLFPESYHKFVISHLDSHALMAYSGFHLEGLKQALQDEAVLDMLALGGDGTSLPLHCGMTLEAFDFFYGKSGKRKRYTSEAGERLVVEFADTQLTFVRMGLQKEFSLVQFEEVV